jgi:hypothetical protein
MPKTMRDQIWLSERKNHIADWQQKQFDSDNAWRVRQPRRARNDLADAFNAVSSKTELVGKTRR